jgi:hypothetical protein
VSDTSPGKKLVLTEEQALELITFLISSAEISLHEPVYYGTFRLIDGASRLMGMLLENDPESSAEFFKSYKDEIDANKTQMMWNREAYYDFLRRIPAQAATELKRVRELADAEGSAS